MVASIPLDNEYFEKIPSLTKADKDAYLQKAHDAVDQMLKMANGAPDSRIGWEPVGVSNSVQLYVGTLKSKTGSFISEDHYAAGVSTIEALLEEIASVFDTSNTLKAKRQRAYYPAMADYHVLHTIEEPKTETPYQQVTIKWLVLDTNSKLNKYRDYVVLEGQRVITDASGRRSWVKVYNSIALKSFPEFKDWLGCTRSEMFSTGYVISETGREGFLKVTYMSAAKKHESLSKQLDPSGSNFKQVVNLSNMAHILTQHRLGEAKLMGNLEMVPKATQSKCKICDAKFNFLTKRKNCRKCGEITCSRCSQKWSIPSDYKMVLKVRVCSHCIALVNEHYAGTVVLRSAIGSSHSDSHEASSSSYSHEKENGLNAFSDQQGHSYLHSDDTVDAGLSESKQSGDIKRDQLSDHSRSVSRSRRGSKTSDTSAGPPTANTKSPSTDGGNPLTMSILKAHTEKTSQAQKSAQKKSPFTPTVSAPPMHPKKHGAKPIGAQLKHSISDVTPENYSKLSWYRPDPIHAGPSQKSSIQKSSFQSSQFSSNGTLSIGALGAEDFDDNASMMSVSHLVPDFDTLFDPESQSVIDDCETMSLASVSFVSTDDMERSKRVDEANASFYGSKSQMSRKASTNSACTATMSNDEAENVAKIYKRIYDLTQQQQLLDYRNQKSVAATTKRRDIEAEINRLRRQIESIAMVVD